jgi:hypothetical protein
MEKQLGWMHNITVNASDPGPFTYYITFDLASHGAVSPFPRIFKKLVYSSDKKGGLVADIFTVPTYTAIIKLTDGVVTDIGWDDGCFFCPENTDECMHTGLDVNTTDEIMNPIFRGCRKTMEQCYPPTMPAANGTADGGAANVTVAQTGCDLKVFLTWTGTDRNGQYLRSASKRFSRYRQFGIATLYQSAINLANEGLNIANTAIAAIESVPGRIVPSTRSDLRRLEQVDEVLDALQNGDRFAANELGSELLDEIAEEEEAQRQHSLRGGVDQSAV